MAQIDMGRYLAATLLDAAVASIAGQGLPTPGIVVFIAGSAVPIEDCCDGLLWTRVVTQYPSDGSADPLGVARIDFDLPAWVYAIELGYLGCHNTIEADGSAIDPAEETAYAQRDSDYRAALMKAAGIDMPPLVEPCVLGQRLQAWQPIGPDGACSGGMLVDFYVSPYLFFQE